MPKMRVLQWCLNSNDEETKPRHDDPRPKMKSQNTKMMDQSWMTSLMTKVWANRRCWWRWCKYRRQRGKGWCRWSKVLGRSSQAKRPFVSILILCRYIISEEEYHYIQKVVQWRRTSHLTYKLLTSTNIPLAIQVQGPDTKRISCQPKATRWCKQVQRQKYL